MRPAHLFRILDDPTGAGFFGVPLWQVADADVWRWRACIVAARRVLGGAHREQADEDE